MRLEITRKGMIEVRDPSGRLVSRNTVIEEAIEDLVADAEAHPEIETYRITYPSREVRVIPKVVVVPVPDEVLVQGSGIQFTQGQAGAFDLGAAIASVIPSGHVVTSITPNKALPSGVSTDLANVEVDYDGAGAAAAVGSAQDPLDVVVVTAPRTFDVDWQQRSTAAGVFYRNNFTYKNAAETQLIANSQDLRNSVYGLPNDSKVVWEQGIKLSGNGSARLNMLVSQDRDDAGFGLDFSGIQQNNALQKTTRKTEFYVQFALYMPTSERDFWFGPNFGGKIAILEAPNLSFDPGEIVLRRGGREWGVWDCYRYTRARSTQPFVLQNPAFSGDGPLQGFYDAGSPAPPIDTVTKMRQRYGVNWNYYRGSQSGTALALPAELEAAPRIPADQWYVFEIYVRMVASGDGSTCKIWGAPYGSQPALLAGAMEAELPLIGATDSQGVPLYTGIQFTNYGNQDQVAINWPSVDTFRCYAEVIASDNPINFPGGHSIPYAGTQVPPDYPYNGWNEN